MFFIKFVLSIPYVCMDLRIHGEWICAALNGSKVVWKLDASMLYNVCYFDKFLCRILFTFSLLTISLLSSLLFYSLSLSLSLTLPLCFDIFLSQHRYITNTLRKYKSTYVYKT